MAGGKETPRQKMIGMMYLVLTALLALNVSKEIIRAFITINDKIETGNVIVKNKNVANLDSYEQKIALANSQKQVDVVKSLKETQQIAYNVDNRTKTVSNFIITQASEMIKLAEGKEWLEEDESVPTFGSDETKWLKLLSLHDIAAMDNYDIPTNYFVKDPSNPSGKGVDILDSIVKFRDFLTVTAAKYQENDKNYYFESPGIRPKTEEDKTNLESEYNKTLDAALETVSREDRDGIKQIYNILSPVEKVKNHGEEVDWVVAQFDHAPIVAAAAILTSLRSDCLQAEAIALDMLGSRVEAPAFKFNKIEPLAFARTGYINAGDSLGLSVMIAAYDTLEQSVIKYGINEDTLEEKWTETKGKITLPGNKPGDYKVKGVIGVKERGQTKFKEWNFNYVVGEPMGVISQPEMDVLYIGYPNKVAATASGFPKEAISLSCSGCSISKTGEDWKVTVSPGTRKATISMSAKGEDGSTTSLGSKDFRVYGTPMPEALFNGKKGGDVPKSTFIGGVSKLSVAVKNSPLANLKYQVNSFVVNIGGKDFPVQGSNLPQNIKNMIKGLNRGSTILFKKIRYSGTQSGITSVGFTLK